VKWLVVAAAACSSATPSTTPPANHAPEQRRPPGPTTRLVVELLPTYASCAAAHVVVVVIDGTESARVVTRSACPIVTHPKPGITITDPQWHREPMGPFDLAPGSHVIELRDLESTHTARFEHVYPVFDDHDKLIIERLGATLDDTGIKFIGLAHQFLTL
jgi:hypothetical protein